MFRKKTLHWLLYSAIPLDNRIKLHVSAKRINGIMTFTEHIKYLNTSENMWLCKGLQFLNVKLSLKWKVFQKPIWIPNSKQYIHYIFFWNRFLLQRVGASSITEILSQYYCLSCGILQNFSQQGYSKVSFGFSSLRWMEKYWCFFSFHYVKYLTSLFFLLFFFSWKQIHTFMKNLVKNSVSLQIMIF